MEEAQQALLSDLINPLIIDETGLMSPFGYGVNERFAVGRSAADLHETIAAYKRSGWRDLRHLLGAAFAALEASEGRFVDWFYHLIETSHMLQYRAAMNAEELYANPLTSLPVLA
jgi:hypothetical protein